MMLPHTTPVSLHLLIRSLGKLHIAPGRRTGGDCLKETLRLRISEKHIHQNSPLVAPDGGRAALWRQITVISAVYFGYRRPEQRGVLSASTHRHSSAELILITPTHWKGMGSCSSRAHANEMMEEPQSWGKKRA